ncbi:MAG: 1-deoxy-D-xylulose-5-phosphate reductoisomerase [Gammaproteobacteria bacterium]|nr:1-deoxy-D-xylulose-5-phosphate reductoisomerase [Gammaproteobacteria bacterium]
MRTIALLGSTGSIGKNVLAVIRQFPEKFNVAALTAGRNIELLADQVKEFDPNLISISDSILVEKLCLLLPDKYHSRILTGDDGNCAAVRLSEVDMVVSAVVGSVGLLPTLEAIDYRKDIGLANKETLVMAGRLVMQRAAEAGINILPIDSEHNAIFQALEAGRREDVSKIILTASGGPFRTTGAHTLKNVLPEQALAHPNWDMGRKISIDSATLMNKGLEVIEARWLFDVTQENIEVVVHPQSIVHSLVEFRDGSVVAQLGIPDMKIPIAYAMSYPARLPLNLSRLNLAQCAQLTFETPDLDRFPCLQLAFDALKKGSIYPAVLNAANEIAVDAFLKGMISFTSIAEIVSNCLDKASPDDDMKLEAILEADRIARVNALEEVQRLAR